MPVHRTGRRRFGLLLAASVAAASLTVTAAPATATAPPPPCERPKPPANCLTGDPTGTLTSVERQPAGLRVTGTATDPDAPGPVRVSVEVNGVYVGEVSTNGLDGRFSGIVPARAGDGVCAFAINRNEGADKLLGCRSMIVRVDPFGHVDQVMSTASGLRVRGWAIDPDSTAPIDVTLSVDGRSVTLGGTPKNFPASLDRPDVGAANPGYGNAHGFDVTLPGPNRHTSVCAFGVDVGSGTAPTASLDCGRDPHAVSVFDLNLQGLQDEYTNDFGVLSPLPWPQRYGRIAKWMADTGTLPDLITFQEVPARKDYRLFHDPPDYQALFVIIDQIKRQTGANYRIAYHSADHVQQGVWSLYQGRALIYNADRLRNTTTLVNSWAVAHNDTTTTGVHMRASWPCDRPSDTFASSCSLIDGEGRHWVSSYVNPQNLTWERGPQAAVFELTNDPSKHIIMVNVHSKRCLEPDPKTAPCLIAERTDQLAISDLVDRISTAWAPRTKLIPPVVAGDFNGGVDMPTAGGGPGYEPTLPDFGDAASTGIDWVLGGMPSIYASVHAPVSESEMVPTPSNRHEYCGFFETLLADHCGLFVQFFPQRMQAIN